MKNSTSNTSRPLRYILLDTNIFTNLNNKQLNEQITFLLQDAVSKGYGLGISQLSIFELLDSASLQNEIKAFSIISGLKQFKILQGVLITAGHLGCLYSEDGIDYQKHPQIGDKIIAATAIVNNAVILTFNGRHFPTPFFKIISTNALKYKQDGGRESYQVCYFLEPDIDIIKKKYDSRLPNKNNAPQSDNKPE